MESESVREMRARRSKRETGEQKKKGEVDCVNVVLSRCSL